MSVLLVTNMWPNAADPSKGIFVRNQSVALMKAGVKHDVVVFPSEVGGLRRYWSGFQLLRDRLSTGRYDLVHAFYGYTVALCCLDNSVPVIGTFCGSDVYHTRQRPISRWAARRCRAVIVRNGEMGRLLGRSDSLVLPSGVDLEQFVPLPRARCRSELGIAESERFILFPCNPARLEKRHWLARDAVERVCARTRESIVLRTVYGRPLDEYRLWLNAADAVILTSMWEGSPNVVKEALACNIAVVSVDVGDVRRLISGIPGCAVTEDTSEALAAGVLQALRTPATTAGRDSIAAYDIRSVTEMLIQSYRSIARRTT